MLLGRRTAVDYDSNHTTTDKDQKTRHDDKLIGPGRDMILFIVYMREGGVYKFLPLHRAAQRTDTLIVAINRTASHIRQFGGKSGKLLL